MEIFDKLDKSDKFYQLRVDVMLTYLGPYYRVNPIVGEEIYRVPNVSSEELIKIAKERGFSDEVLEEQYGIRRVTTQTSNIVSFPKQAI